MTRYRFETRTARARRDARNRLVAHVAAGLFLCLTIIGSPIGIALIIAAARQHSKSTQAITAAEHAMQAKASSRARDEQIRLYRSLD